MWLMKYDTMSAVLLIGAGYHIFFIIYDMCSKGEGGYNEYIRGYSSYIEGISSKRHYFLVLCIV